MDRWTRYNSPDGDTEVRHARFRFLRRLTLRGPDGMFLDRWGIDTKTFGIFVHHLTAPDPGRDLHDHPWGFASLVLWGGYTEEVADAREAAGRAAEAEPPTLQERVARFNRLGLRRDWCHCQGVDPWMHKHYRGAPHSCARCECGAYSPVETIDRGSVGDSREWTRGSAHRIRLTEAHRITHVQPHTWTLVFRGRKTRYWGFYPPTGYVGQREYDYSGRGR